MPQNTSLRRAYADWIRKGEKTGCGYGVYVYKENIVMNFMLDGINDSDECAIELADRLKGLNCYVNLIPYNETENIGYKRTNSAQIMRFYDILKKNKTNVTIRKEFGGKVDAACGQLRANQIGG